MIKQALAISLMSLGSVTALVAASGPLKESNSLLVTYIIAIACIVAGAILRQTKSDNGLSTGAGEGGTLDPIPLLAPLSEAIESVCEKYSNQDDLHFLDSELAEATALPIRDFLSHYQRLRDGLGIEKFANLMIRFATVERLINRTISAAADGALEEARTSLTRANEAMAFCLECPGINNSTQVTER